MNSFLGVVKNVWIFILITPHRRLAKTLYCQVSVPRGERGDNDMFCSYCADGCGYIDLWWMMMMMMMLLLGVSTSCWVSLVEYMEYL